MLSKRYANAHEIVELCLTLRRNVQYAKIENKYVLDLMAHLMRKLKNCCAVEECWRVLDSFLIDDDLNAAKKAIQEILSSGFYEL